MDNGININVRTLKEDKKRLNAYIEHVLPHYLKIMIDNQKKTNEILESIEQKIKYFYDRE